MTHVVLASGAMVGYALAGAVSAIEAPPEEISGASAGAIVGAVYVATRGENMIGALDVDMNALFKPDVKNAVSKWGLVDTAPMRAALVEAMGCDPTFAELYARSPIKLFVAATRVATASVEYFSVDTHPDTSVCDAVCASACVPFVFAPVRINGHAYTDGACTEKVPTMPFAARAVDDVLVIDMHNEEMDKEPTTFAEFACRHIAMALDTRAPPPRAYPTVRIDTTRWNLFDPGLSWDDKIQLFGAGHRALTRFRTRGVRGDASARTRTTV